jgi:hypothetical protein
VKEEYIAVRCSASRHLRLVDLNGHFSAPPSS